MCTNVHIFSYSTLATNNTRSIVKMMSALVRSGHGVHVYPLL